MSGGMPSRLDALCASGRSTGPRHLNGALLDVRHAAQFLGVTEKTLRARVARRLVPFKRLGGRVVFIKSDLETFLSALDGCSIDEALQNIETRQEGTV
jgi:excisionase family DNA binding protein